MKQSYLIGKIEGLKPSQKKRLESLIHCRHPKNQGVNLSVLEALAEEALSMKKKLHIILDERGVCRLMYIGELDTSRDIISKIPKFFGKESSKIRLISCFLKFNIKQFSLSKRNAMLAFDLQALNWLIFAAEINKNGQRSSYFLKPNPLKDKGWELLEFSDLNSLDFDSFDYHRYYKDNPPVNSIKRTLLLILTTSDCDNNLRSLSELKGLVRTSGAKIVAIASQKSSSFNPQTVWGKGKLEEVALEVRRVAATSVITDRNLTPAQARNVEKILDCPVMDRSELILDIFARHASSSSGRLQVELAQLRYLLPRLIGRGKSFSRQGGGIGTRGPGEKQLEKDRRVIIRRVESLKQDLVELHQHRSLMRKKRSDIPRVALVGYTNVGKSTLLNSLCALKSDRQVITKNKLFATLDPTTRRLLLPRKGETPDQVLITDTVGFIKDLPVTLMEAFKATLEETLQADLLLLLVDLSNHDWNHQLNTVNQLLDNLDVKGDRQLVANQIDQCDSKAIKSIAKIDSQVLYVSAASGAGLKGLKISIQDYFWPKKSELEQVQSIHLK